jgi:hypothetical protein
VSDEFSEDFIQLEQVKDAHIAVIWVELGQERLIATAFGFILCLPETGEDCLTFFFRKDIRNDTPALLFQVSARMGMIHSGNACHVLK